MLHPPGPIPEPLVLAAEPLEEDIVEEEGPERSVRTLPAMDPCPAKEGLLEETVLGGPTGPPEELIPGPTPIPPILIPAIVVSDEDDHPALKLCGAGDATVETESEFDDPLLCECLLLRLSSAERLLNHVGFRMNGLDGDEEREDDASGVE